MLIPVLKIFSLVRCEKEYEGKKVTIKEAEQLGNPFFVV